MGKIKGVRQKYHASLKHGNEEEMQPTVEVAKTHLVPVIDKTDTVPQQRYV